MFYRLREGPAVSPLLFRVPHAGVIPNAPRSIGGVRDLLFPALVSRAPRGRHPGRAMFYRLCEGPAVSLESNAPPARNKKGRPAGRPKVAQRALPYDESLLGLAEQSPLKYTIGNLYPLVTHVKEELCLPPSPCPTFSASISALRL